MFLEIITVFTIIFIAELGDKSQILAMSFATRYSIKQVLTGVFIGIVINHILAVVIGILVGSIFLSSQIGYLVALVFIVFAYLSLLDRGEEELTKVKQYGPIITISIAFFFGELGDKTQLATMAFASESATPFLILVGSVTAMIMVSYIGIIVGRKLGEKIPDYYIRLLSSILFIGYGTLKIIETQPTSTISVTWIIVILALIFVGYIGLFTRSIYVYRATDLTTFQRVAKHLHEYHTEMERMLDVICLGEDFCGPCRGKDCVIGHTKYLVEQSKQGQPIDVSHLNPKTFKSANKEDILKAIDITLEEIKDHWDDPDFKVLHLIRENLDYLLFKKKLSFNSYTEYEQYIQKYKETMKA